MTDQTAKIHVPPKGTRGNRMMDFFMGLMRPFAGREVSRLQKRQGPEPATFMGFPVLILTTVGAKSGKERSTVLGGFPDGDNAWLIIASNGRSATHPAWFHNIRPDAEQAAAQVGALKFNARGGALTGKARGE